MYEIYSIGDGAYLTAVLNAVAMLTGGDDIRDLAGIGFLMGVILVMFQGILQARFPPLQNVLVAWVIYMAMFGPTARVQVEDLYTGATRHVDNVPLGVAFVGSAMSRVGYGVTRLFEQAFSTPAMTDYGFAAPLQLLQDVRKGTWSATAQGKAVTPVAGADMEKSWSNYIADCVLWNVDTGRVAMDTILRDPNWSSAFDARGQIAVTTELWLGGAPVTNNCTVAWGLLSNSTTTAYLPAIRRSLAATLDLEEGNVDSSIQAALDALAGMGTDAQEYMVMASIAPFWTTGKANVYRELGNYAEATMVEQAAQQRNTQWAAEERLFSRIVRPMMTFFEAFLFAISPLMMFAIGLGPTGIGMIGKYLVFALWIQLWKPIMAVVHLYVIMAAGRKLDALQDVATGDVPIPSLSAIWKMDLILSDYLGTGGMLAASTPAISLMLIYGSAITATHLAGRLQGGDSINEKMVSPDVQQPAAALTMGPLQTNTRLGGTTAPDAHQAMPSLNLGFSRESEVRSAATAQEQSMETFRSTLAKVASRSAQESNSSGSGGTSSYNVSTSQSEVDRFATERAESIRKDLKLDESYRDTIASAYSAGLKVAVGGGGDEATSGSAAAAPGTGGAATASAGAAPGAGGAAPKSRVRDAIRDVLTTASKPVAAAAGFVGDALGVEGKLHGDGGIRGEHQSVSAVQDSITDAVSRSIKADTSNSVELARRQALDSFNRQENLFTHGASKEDRSQLEKAATDTVTATRAFEQAQAMRSQHGMSTSIRADHLAQALVSNPQKWHEANKEFTTRFGYLEHDLGKATDRYRHLLGSENARAFGMVKLLVGREQRTAPMSPDQQRDAQEFGYRLAAQAPGYGQVDTVDPYANQGLRGVAPAFGQTRSNVNGGGLYDPRDEASYLPNRARNHERAVKAIQDNTYGEIHERHAADRDSQVLSEARAQAQVNEVRRETLAQQIREQGLLPQSLPAWTVDKVGGLLKSVSGQFTKSNNGLEEGIGRSIRALADGQGIDGMLSAFGDGWGQARQEIRDVRLDAVRGTGDRQLTDAQMGVYRAAFDSYLPNVLGVQSTFSTDVDAARQRLVAEEGAIGEAMANILVSAAWSQQDAGLAPVRAYNQSEVDEEKLRAKIEDLEKPSAEPRGGRVGSVMSDPDGASAMVQTARRLGLEPVEFVAMMSWESAGTLNPNKLGGDGGVYRGLIQFSPENQRRYGVREGQSIAEQIPAVERYLLDRGFIPGQHAIEHAYSAVLAGNASEEYWDRQDSNGTSVRNAAERFRSGAHVDRAVRFLRSSLS